MRNVMHKLINDEAGFIVSSELVLIATIVVLAMIVGLSEIAHAVNQEMEDVASAFGSVNQTYRYDGLEGHYGKWEGSRYRDRLDFCDSDQDVVATQPRGEGKRYRNNN